MRTLSLLKYLRLILIFTAFTVTSVYSQSAKEGGVGIGTTTPDQSAILDLSSSTKGLLLPRLTVEQRSNILNPAPGLMVYQTDMLSGIYLYDGKSWDKVGNSSITGARLTAADETVWGTSGNAGLNSSLNFIGTTDTTNLVFKVNNQYSGILDYKRGMTSFGYKSGILSKGYNSVVIGSLAMQKASTGGNNVVMGYQAMFSNERGDHNVAVGSGVLAANPLGEKNTAIGSLAGYKSTGSNNVLIGFQAGYFESTSNKLHISNDASKAPLIYGDFELNRVGINTTTLGAAFTINSGSNNISGLRFEKMNSNSPTVANPRKVLSLNSSGDVILVPDYFEPANTTYWNANGNDISNKNTGLVNIAGNLSIAGNTNSKGMSIGVDGLQFTGLGNATGKFLGLDAAGKVKLVDAPVVTPTSTPTTVASDWTRTEQEIKNNNTGIVGISNGLKFYSLNSSSPTQASSNKVLSVDANGNVILVDDQRGNVTVSGGDATLWTSVDNKIQNGNNANVKFTNNLEVDGTVYSRWFRTSGFAVGELGMTFTGINSSSTAVAGNGKVLSVDADGKVILVTVPVGVSTTPTTTTPTTTTGSSSFWGESNGALYAQNNAKVVIGSGITNLPAGFNLYVKDGILAERVRVAVANSDKWADYVFDRNYQLMPIKDVAKFIEAKKHLPNVPSAAEVAENGLDLAEIVSKQMEKIEELTLYMIQANQRIDELEKQVEKK